MDAPALWSDEAERRRSGAVHRRLLARRDRSSLDLVVVGRSNRRGRPTMGGVKPSGPERQLSSARQSSGPSRPVTSAIAGDGIEPGQRARGGHGKEGGRARWASRWHSDVPGPTDSRRSSVLTVARLPRRRLPRRAACQLAWARRHSVGPLLASTAAITSCADAGTVRADAAPASTPAGRAIPTRSLP